MSENQQQIRPATPEEDIKVLYGRVAKLNDAMSALLDPRWGANVGILPKDHPLYPKTLEPLPSSFGHKASEQEQAAPVDWQDIAKRRERELKQVGEARRRAEAAIARVRQLAAAQQTEGVDGGPCDADTLWPSEVLAALDGPANNGEQSPRTTPDNSPTSSDTPDSSALHGLIRQALHDADDHSCQQQDGVDYDRLTAAALDTIRPLGKFLGDMHRNTEADLSRVIALYERWLKAGAPPLGVSINRWWDRRLLELRHAISPEQPQEQP